MWSITATPPILRIFVYHNHASLVLSGSCDPHGSRNRSDPVTKSYHPLPYATWAILCFQTITYCYHRRACDSTVDQVGLDLIVGGLPIVTRHYHASDLS